MTISSLPPSRPPVSGALLMITVGAATLGLTALVVWLWLAVA